MTATEQQLDVAQTDVVSILQGNRSGNTAGANERPVLAAKILNGGGIRRDVDSRMKAGDAMRVDPHTRRIVATDRIVAQLEEEFTLAPNQTTLRMPHGIRLASDERRVRLKRVAESLDGPDNPGTPAIVAKRRANVGDKIRNIRLADENVRPERVLNVLLGHGIRPTLNEQIEQLKSFGRQRDTASAPAHFAGV